MGLMEQGGSIHSKSRRNLNFTDERSPRLKKFGASPSRPRRRFSGLKSASQSESASRIKVLQQSHASGNLLECADGSETTPRTTSSFQKSFFTCVCNGSLAEDGSSEEYFGGSAIMQLASQSLASSGSMEAGTNLQESIVPVNRVRSMKKERSDNTKKSTRLAMDISSKDTAGFKPNGQKLEKGLKVDEKKKREVARVRSQQVVKTILPVRVKLPTLGDEPVQSLGQTKATLIHVDKENPSLSSTVIKKSSMSPPKRIQLSPKPALQLKAKLRVLKSMPQLMVTGRTTGRNSQEKSMIAMTASVPKLGEKKFFRTNAAPSPSKSTNKVAPGKSVKSHAGSGRLDSEMVEEKILHVVQQKLFSPKHLNKVKSPQQSSTILPSRSSISFSKNVKSSFKEEKVGDHSQSSDACRSIFNGEGKGRSTPFCSGKTDDKRKQKKITNIRLEEDSLSPRITPFHGRKMVGVQRGNTGPRKLRFKKANVVAEPQSSLAETGMISLKNMSEPTAGNLATRSPDPRSVLRHQDVQKYPQALFNDVIEETANKLVEIRKSKVKALVGAFETIISLQDKAIC